MEGIAILFDKNFKKKGIATFKQVSKQNTKYLYIYVKAKGVKLGKHGIHIHTSGDLSKGSSTLCDHYNPYNKNHGGLKTKERHLGDLGNVIETNLKEDNHEKYYVQWKTVNMNETPPIDKKINVVMQITSVLMQNLRPVSIEVKEQIVSFIVCDNKQKAEDQFKYFQKLLSSYKLKDWDDWYNITVIELRKKLHN